MKTYIYIFSIIAALFSWKAKAQGGDSLVGVTGIQVQLSEPLFQYDSTIASSNPLSSSGPYKRVFLVHGLAGSSASLSNLSADINLTFNADATMHDYNIHQFSFLTASNAVKTEIDNYLLVHPNEEFQMNIAIGHSQGGLVVRNMNRLYDLTSTHERRYGAYITLGTPNNGATILNNHSYIMDMADMGCDYLTDGPFKENIENNFWIRLLGLDNTLSEVKDTVCGLVAYRLIPTVLSQNLDPITNQYMTGASFIEDTLKPYNDNIPKLAFYGLESEPVFWRTFHWLVNDPNDFAPYMAKDEYELETISQFHELRSSYRANKEYWQRRADMSFWQSYATYLPWISRINRKEASEIAAGYNYGEWYLRAMNMMWKIIIGHTELEWFTTDMYLCECDYGPYQSTNMVYSSNQCESFWAGYDEWIECEARPAQYYTVEFRNGHSDGVVTMESATALPGALHHVKMENTSHMQMRNAPELGSKLKEETFIYGIYGEDFQLTPQ